MNRRLIVKLWLFAGFLAIGIIFLLKENLRKDYQDLQKAASITADNIAYTVMPPRTAVFGLENKEEALRVTFEGAFFNFSADDWRQLWKIIYGIYPDYEDSNERMPARQRQLTLGEMEEKLKANLPHPFSYFKPEHWQLFWKTLKIKE